MNPKIKTRSIAILKYHYKLIKYLDFNRYELYDLKKDPAERQNLIQKDPELFFDLKKELNNMVIN